MYETIESKSLYTCEPFDFSSVCVKLSLSDMNWSFTVCEKSFSRKDNCKST